MPVLSASTLKSWMVLSSSLILMLFFVLRFLDACCNCVKINFCSSGDTGAYNHCSISFSICSSSLSSRSLGKWSWNFVMARLIINKVWYTVWMDKLFWEKIFNHPFAQMALHKYNFYTLQEESFDGDNAKYYDDWW